MNGLISEVAHSLQNTGTLGTISLVAFFIGYLSILLWTLSRSTDEMDNAADMPLHDDMPLASSAGTQNR